jgi:hypothetical protein
MVTVEVFDPASTRVPHRYSELKLRNILLRETLLDWIENIFWNPSISYTTAASLFVTAETTFKGFIPVVKV